MLFPYILEGIYIENQDHSRRIDLHFDMDLSRTVLEQETHFRYSNYGWVFTDHHRYAIVMVNLQLFEETLSHRLPVYGRTHLQS